MESLPLPPPLVGLIDTLEAEKHIRPLDRATMHLVEGAHVIEADADGECRHDVIGLPVGDRTGGVVITGYRWFFQEQCGLVVADCPPAQLQQLHA